jgi:hypothetical protein
MELNPNFITEITEDSDTQITLKVWRAVDGNKATVEPSAVYNITKTESADVMDVCAAAAPHVFA